MITAAQLQAQAQALGLGSNAATSVAFIQACAIDRLADGLAAIAATLQANVYGDAGKTLDEQQLKSDATVAQQRLQLSQGDATLAQNFITTLGPLVQAWLASAQLEGGASKPAAASATTPAAA